MFSLWELSTDSVVTATIVVGISALAIAWLFAGRRSPAKNGGLEQRRLEGREAEVFMPPAAPLVEIDTPLPEAASVEAPDEIQAETHQVEAPISAPQEVPEHQHLTKADTTLPPEDQPLIPTQSPPAAKAPPVIRSAEQSSAMSIAAALVRHDKREAAPAKPTGKEVPLEGANIGGDDLTAIDGIDAKMAKEMNDLGIRYFDQIISWAPDHAAWITSRLSSPVTVAQRTAWMAEAKTLAERPATTVHNRTERAS